MRTFCSHFVVASTSNPVTTFLQLQQQGSTKLTPLDREQQKPINISQPMTMWLNHRHDGSIQWSHQTLDTGQSKSSTLLNASN